MRNLTLGVGFWMPSWQDFPTVMPLLTQKACRYSSLSACDSNLRTVRLACLPSPADRPRYFTVGSSEQSGQLLILPPAVRFASEWGLKDTPQIIQSRIQPRGEMVL